jgi:hypothetical protein
MQKASPQEKVVIACLVVGLLVLGISFVAFYPLNVNGRPIPPNPTHGKFILIVAALTLIAAIYISIKFFGAKEGLKTVAREGAPGLLIITGAGAMVGFFLRAIFGKNLLFIFFLIYAGAVYYAYTIYKKSNN